jgi:hypothetical protein
MIHAEIVKELDAEIAWLQSVKALLSSAETVAIKRKPGRPATKTVASAPTNRIKSSSNQTLSRCEKIGQAQRGCCGVAASCGEKEGS